MATPWRGMAGASAMIVLVVPLSLSQVSPVGPAPADAMALATAMAVDPSLLTFALFHAHPDSVPTPAGPVGSGLATPHTDLHAKPTGIGEVPMTGFGIPHGSGFAVLTTGLAASAAGTPSDLASTRHGHQVAGANDVVILRVDLDVPGGHDCLRLDFQFLTEEYPEWWGSVFNDAFIAELDLSSWSAAGGAISAPNNFAHDGTGAVITLNSAWIAAGPATGTAYDGATPHLVALTPITPGAHSLYVSIFDATDQRLDSAVFLDNLHTFDAPTTACVQGASPYRDAPAVTALSFPDEVCENVPFTFTNSAAPASGEALDTMAWDFGDGNLLGPVAYSTSTTHTYTTGGTYVATLTIADTSGQSASLASALFVFSNPDDCLSS